MTDLEACYNRQLLNIGNIMQESVGVERRVMQLLTKVIPCFEHYTCMSFGPSKEFYGELLELVVANIAR